MRQPGSPLRRTCRLSRRCRLPARRRGERARVPPAQVRARRLPPAALPAQPLSPGSPAAPRPAAQPHARPPAMRGRIPTCPRLADSKLQARPPRRLPGTAGGAREGPWRARGRAVRGRGRGRRSRCCSPALGSRHSRLLQQLLAAALPRQPPPSPPSQPGPARCAHVRRRGQWERSAGGGAPRGGGRHLAVGTGEGSGEVGGPAWADLKPKFR